MDPEFSRAELLANHPLGWLVEVNGLIVDARMLPIELQAEAQRLGLIPSVPLGQPGVGPSSTAVTAAQETRAEAWRGSRAVERHDCFALEPAHAALSQWRHLDHWRAGRRASMRSRKAVDADELCVGNAGLLHTVAPALVSATGG